LLIECLHQMLPTAGCCHPCRSQFGAEAFILHYTYGQDLGEGGAFTPGVRGFWHWDKREYEQAYPPRNISLPVKCQVRTLAAQVLLVSALTLTLVPSETMTLVGDTYPRLFLPSCDII